MYRSLIVSIIVAALFLGVLGGRAASASGGSVEVLIDDAAIEKNDPWLIVQPMWWSVSIYDGPEVYWADLQKFSIPQRYLLAILWYDADVNNGGHHQFFLNSTGVVWRDALKGLDEIGALEYAGMLRAAAEILGGSPSLNSDERDLQMQNLPDDAFELLDWRYSDGVGFYDKLMQYIKRNRSAFYFKGVVRKP